MRLLFFLFIFFILPPFGNGQTNMLKKGLWTGALQLNDTTSLYFKFNIGLDTNTHETLTFEIINASEIIPLVVSQQKNSDSIELAFPFFNSHLVLSTKSDTLLIGYWKNKNKGDLYMIPCSIHYGYSFRFPFSNKPIHYKEVEGKWESVFSPNTEDQEKTIGLFKQSQHTITGTFLTETGDYRFLEGNIFQDKLFLSCFDGSHAFLFTATIQDKEMNGWFYSGKHYHTSWVAYRNENFTLTHPDSLTKQNQNKDFSFSIKDLEGNLFTYPNEVYKDKVLIIQIMGTWCPNCMDETVFLKELYQKYHSEGLEIISVAYETGNDRNQQIKQIQKLIQKQELKHLFLLGGTSNKQLASEQFHSLNKIISFPTTIFIDRTGKIQKIHTGFNGPGTGEIYQNFKRETESFLKTLLPTN
jgi:thiol-disulfide isomerase/thioredoxin